MELCERLIFGTFTGILISVFPPFIQALILSMELCERIRFFIFRLILYHIFMNKASPSLRQKQREGDFSDIQLSVIGKIEQESGI